MADFKRKSELQKIMLQRLTEVVKDYLEVVEKPMGGRHRKTTLSFVGDRYRPVDIVTRYVVPKRQISK